MKKEKLIAHLNPLFFQGICHRGLHNEQYTENGLKAFENAMNHQMAIELDVHLTTDNGLIVCHDSELKRVTGKAGIIENMSVPQVQENYHLLDGEKIPTLKEVFDLVQERVPIVVELKVYKGNYRPLAKRLAEELKLIKDKRNIMLISFDPRALLPFKNSGFVRQLLVINDGKHNWIYSLRGLYEGLDMDYTFMKKKRYQRYGKKHLVNVWTIQSKEQVDMCLPYVDMMTFQNMDESYVHMELTKKNSRIPGVK